ncbi:hypothetical protein ACU4M6_005248 [Raoultella ornithinolytica]|uniref:hypothetical protein n=1 Tax=Raoultella ornithinolytica TaxID=54291 RepID=UPI000CF34ACB|nr:hypothetical protein [Raoultella ornithinolytica]ELK6036195.1 hypothetical protein [Raoultella ornithinolytica]ELM7288113.1 hypothetical protein [Raoultella ornithinolytica]ELO0975295.1 hypothetical protein [Raoultella ornithinolytica]PQH11859.1 hypothetical protein C5T92_26895 [Raoultella ornithinolytica]PQH35116.1 hypothetical protein C5T94_22905 [Raoultella ornithinolytica]
MDKNFWEAFMSVQQETPDTQNNHIPEYQEILKVLEKRASKSRMTIIILIYFMMIAASIVVGAAYYIKTNQSPISDLTNYLYSISEKAKNEATLKELAESLQALSKIKNRVSNEMNQHSDIDESPFTASAFNNLFANNSPSEKIATSIASVLLSFSLILFIGFVMKSILVFIRYYMQLGTDFDNQKIAFILSKGDQSQFQQYLSSLRDHNISFEKTPTLPQEKIIASLIEALVNAKNKSKDV